jgi:uncharacterized protein YutE (UPF0331/DUF86 family)
MDKEFIAAHKAHVEKTLALLTSICSRGEIGSSDQVALATLVQNIYTGIENIIRNILEGKGANLEKNANWHKELLSRAVEYGVISNDLQERLLKYLAFRNYHIHGYGYMLNWDSMKQFVDDAPIVVESFFRELNKKGNL